MKAHCSSRSPSTGKIWGGGESIEVFREDLHRCMCTDMALGVIEYSAAVPSLTLPLKGGGK